MRFPQDEVELESFCTVVGLVVCIVSVLITAIISDAAGSVSIVAIVVFTLCGLGILLFAVKLLFPYNDLDFTWVIEKKEEDKYE